MDYYFYNTDANALSRKGRFSILIEEGFAATSGPRRFGEQLRSLSQGDTLLMYENRLGVVAVGTVLERWDRKTHRPPLYYLSGDDGFDHEYRIKVNWFLDLSENPITIKDLKRHVTSTPRGAIRKIIKWREVIERMIAKRRAALSFFPEEITESSLYVEGASRQISVNAYERNPAARAACIKHHGSSCVICGFNFGSVFGARADGYIHVHHIRPLSEIGEEYEVDPITDLRPVCPNCHAVIHLGGASRSIKEVKRLLACPTVPAS